MKFEKDLKKEGGGRKERVENSDKGLFGGVWKRETAVFSTLAPTLDVDATRTRSVGGEAAVRARRLRLTGGGHARQTG